MEVEGGNKPAAYFNQHVSEFAALQCLWQNRGAGVCQVHSALVAVELFSELQTAAGCNESLN